MTHNHPETRDRSAVSSTWWTPRRLKAASICGFAGGLGGLGVAGPLLGSTGPGIELGAVGLLYPVWHVLLAVALLAANVRYGPGYGRSGRIVAIFLALSLVSYAGLTLILMAVRTVPVDRFVFGILAGTTYMAIRSFATLYGVFLWRQKGERTLASGLTAVLFVAALPAVFVLGLLTQLGFPGELISVPFYLAWIGLSYDLWTVEADAVARNSGGMDRE